MQANRQNELDQRVTKALLRKIDLRLMPLLTLLYFISFLDRMNISKYKDAKRSTPFLSLQRTCSMVLVGLKFRLDNNSTSMGSTCIFYFLCKSLK